MKTKLAVLGCGNMGSAIVLGLGKESPFACFAYDPDHARAKKLSASVGGQAVQKMGELKECEYFLLAVKPQQFDALAEELKKVVTKESKIISIIAGIASNKIQKGLGIVKLARIMPNTPCLVGAGACALFFSEMNGSEKEIVQSLFSSIAKVYFVDSDDAVDMATATIGSGPAYFFEITRIMAAKMKEWGFDSKTAESIAKQVIHGASALMLKSEETIETLRNNVTSKKGTTEAGLESFKKNNLENTVNEALEKAYKRAKELSG